jgi:hypothetical protein
VQTYENTTKMSIFFLVDTTALSVPAGVPELFWRGWWFYIDCLLTSQKSGCGGVGFFSGPVWLKTFLDRTSDLNKSEHSHFFLAPIRNITTWTVLVVHIKSSKMKISFFLPLTLAPFLVPLIHGQMTTVKAPMGMPVEAPTGMKTTTEAPTGVEAPTGMKTSTGVEAPTEAPTGVEAPAGMKTTTGVEAPTEAPTGVEAPVGMKTAIVVAAPTEAPTGVEAPAGMKTAIVVEAPAEAPTGVEAPAGMKTAIVVAAPAEAPNGMKTTTGVEAPAEAPTGVEAPAGMKTTTGMTAKMPSAPAEAPTRGNSASSINSQSVATSDGSFNSHSLATIVAMNCIVVGTTIVHTL